MISRSIADIGKVHSNVEGIKKLSDRVVGIGPFGIGLDGLLTWVPVLGSVYSVGAGGWLIYQAMRARVRPGTIARMAAYLGLDAVATTVGEIIPLAPDVIDMLFPGHLMAARALQADIEATHWVEGRRSDAEASGEHERHQQTLRDEKKLKRIVYLHD